MWSLPGPGGPRRSRRAPQARSCGAAGYDHHGVGRATPSSSLWGEARACVTVASAACGLVAAAVVVEPAAWAAASQGTRITRAYLLGNEVRDFPIEGSGPDASAAGFWLTHLMIELPGAGMRSRALRGEVRVRARRWTRSQPGYAGKLGRQRSLAAASITLAGAGSRVMTPKRASTWECRGW